MDTVANDSMLNVGSADRPSLLDALKERINSKDQRSVVHQLIVVSQVGPNLKSDDAKEELSQEYKAMFATLREHRAWIQVTGLLLMYEKYVLHVVEAPPDVIVDIARAIAGHEDEGKLETGRVLYSYDMLTAAFPTYDSRVLHISSTQEYKTSDAPEAVASDVVSSVNALGGFVTSHTAGPATALERLQSEAAHLLCPQGMLEFLVRMQDLETIRDYAARLGRYLHVTMDGDLIWPVPERLYPYD